MPHKVVPSWRSAVSQLLAELVVHRGDSVQEAFMIADLISKCYKESGTFFLPIGFS